MLIAAPAPLAAAAVAILTASSIAASPAGDGAATLQPIEKGAMAKIHYYSPKRLELSPEKPRTLTKEPPGLTAPLYGVLPIAGATKDVVFHIILDEPGSGPTKLSVEAARESTDKPAKLYVDSNGNGDLTDDPPAQWEAKTSDLPDGKKSTMYNGSGSVQIGTKDKPFNAALGMYRFDRNDPGRAQLKNTLLFYRDYGAEGTATIGGKEYKVMLSDDATVGDFRGAAIEEKEDAKKDQPHQEGSGDSGVHMLIDVNGNGKFDRSGETYDVRKPFNIAGTTYEITDMARDGTSFKVVKSSKTVKAERLPPDHEVGRKITAFEATKMDGKTVNFPGDYKGRIVMLDFWATWCGPCMGEVPGLAKTYAKLHDQGFDILGITLDKENAEDKIKKVTTDNKMTWPQVYDGKFWKAAIADLYLINSIPAAFLVDGDSGEILAAGEDLRGKQLEGTIQAALDKKKGK